MRPRMISDIPLLLRHATPVEPGLFTLVVSKEGTAGLTRSVALGLSIRPSETRFTRVLHETTDDE